MSGEVNSDCTLCGVGDGVDATVWRISPIWQVTAVQGKEPMKDPIKQSIRGTPQTPQAILMPDQGTMPMRRRIESRIHGDDFVFSELDAPSIAFRVRSSAFGKNLTTYGANGAARRLANIDPIVVRKVRRSVASAGENRAPARTFCQQISTSAHQVSMRISRRIATHPEDATGY